MDDVLREAGSGRNAYLYQEKPSGDFESMRKDLSSSPFQFPIELTAKDYLRRLLGICALGIRPTILQIMADRKLPSIPEEFDEDDLHHLLRHVMGDGEGKGSLKVEQQRPLREHLADSLGIDLVALSQLSTAMLQHCRELARSRTTTTITTTDSHMELLTAFTQAIELLQCFGTPAASALRSVQVLAAQYHQHRRFKLARLVARGWSTDAIASYSDDHDDHYHFLAQPSEAALSSSALYALQLSPSDLKAAGVSASQLIDTSGDTTGHRQGYTVAELKLADFSVVDLQSAGCKVSELAAAGYTARTLAEAGCTVSELATAGYSLTALQAAGVPVPLLLSGGYNASELRKAGVPAAALVVAGGYDALQLRFAGYRCWRPGFR